MRRLQFIQNIVNYQVINLW